MRQAVGRTLKIFACATALASCAQAEVRPSIAEFVFEQLGPQSCELMPQEMNGPRLRAITTENPDAPVARGPISGELEGEFFGGGVFGADADGHIVVGMQGAMVESDDDSIKHLCLLIVSLGGVSPSTESGKIVPEQQMDEAPAASFVAPYQIWDRDEAGVPRRLAIGTASDGSIEYTLNDAGQLSGTVSVHLSSLSGPGEIDATLTLPAAENVISPLPRLSREETQEMTE